MGRLMLCALGRMESRTRGTLNTQCCVVKGTHTKIEITVRMLIPI
jgi:hypothetical protein